MKQIIYLIPKNYGWIARRDDGSELTTFKTFIEAYQSLEMLGFDVRLLKQEKARYVESVKVLELGKKLAEKHKGLLKKLKESIES